MAEVTTVAQLVTTDPVTVQRDQPVSEVYHMLKYAPFHHVPVMEHDHPVGMISSVDVLRLAYDIDGFDERDMAEMLDYHFTIDDAMSTDLRTVQATATITDAAELLSDGMAHSLLVVDDEGRLEGIITTTDLIRHLARVGSPQPT
ncbi:MAG: CBS domain-containing protein [Acidimicrobiia bacterium]|nr:CBS domain-containing protein [Acidimicrobiia bacterium]MDH5520929.1 CBS domain-containing protein [Acidimicrobiia bacterium]